MCLATLVMVACKDKNTPDNQGGQGTEQGGGEDIPEYNSPINVKDNSIADWDALDQKKVAVANVTEEPYFPALKQIKVYSDGVYINYLLVFDPELYKNHAGIQDGMHIFIDVDHSAETGGFFDYYADASVDLMFEGALFEGGNPVPYSPTMHRWIGPEGGTPDKRTGEWDDVWESLGSIKGESQLIGDNIIEGRLIVGLISNDFAEEGFGIGFDIQQNWNGVGMLPQQDAVGEEGDQIGRSNILFVPFDESEE